MDDVNNAETLLTEDITNINDLVDKFLQDDEDNLMFKIYDAPEYTQFRDDLVNTLKELFNDIELKIKYKEIELNDKTFGLVKKKSDKSYEIIVNRASKVGLKNLNQTVMHEVMHILIGEALEKDSGLKKLVKNLHEIAKENLTYEVFLFDKIKSKEMLEQIAQAHDIEELNELVKKLDLTEDDIKEAKKQYEYFLGDGSDPEEFFVEALTNVGMLLYLNNVQYDPTKLLSQTTSKGAKRVKKLMKEAQEAKARNKQKKDDINKFLNENIDKVSFEDASKLRKRKKELKAEEAKPMLLGLVHMIFNTILDLFKGISVIFTQKPNKGDSIVLKNQDHISTIFAVAKVLAEHQRAEYVEKAPSLIDLMMEDSALAQKFKEIDDKAQEKIKKTLIKFDEFNDGLNNSERVNKFLERIEKIPFVHDIIRNRVLKTVWATITKPTNRGDLAKLFKLYRKGKETINKYSTNVKDKVKFIFDKELKNWTGKEKNIFLNHFFKYDLSIFEPEEIKKMFGSEDELNKMIEELNKELIEKIQEEHIVLKVVNKTMNLARRLTGTHSIVNEEFNAYSVLLRTGLTQEQIKELVPLVDKLASLQAVKIFATKDKNIYQEMQEVIKDENKFKNLINISTIIREQTKKYNEVFDSILSPEDNFAEKGKLLFENKNKKTWTLVPKDVADEITRRGTTKHKLMKFGTIDGIEYYAVYGDDISLGMEEGLLATADISLRGVSLTQILRDQEYRKAIQQKENMNEAEYSARKSASKIIKRFKPNIDNDFTSDLTDIFKTAEFDEYTMEEIKSLNINSDFIVTPIYRMGENGYYIADFKIDLKDDYYKNQLEYDYDLSTVLANNIFESASRYATTIHDIEAVDKLFEYYDKNSNKENFVKIQEMSDENKDYNNYSRWDKLPDTIKKYIQIKYQKSFLPIPDRFLETFTSEQNLKASNLNIYGREIIKNPYHKELIDTIFKLIADLVSKVKIFQIIKDVDVTYSNWMSNAKMAWTYAKVNPISFFSRAADLIDDLEEYIADSAKLQEEELIKATLQDKEELELSQIRINNLMAKIKKNKFHDLIKDGQYSLIIEGENTEDSQITLVDKLMNKGAKKLTEKLPKKLQKAEPTMKNIIDFVTIGENTELYKVLTKAAQYGDIITKQIIYEEMQKELKKKDNWNELTRETALNFLDQMLINYTYIDHRFVRFLEKIGGFVYSKYFLRGIKAYTDAVIQKPGRFATFEAIESMLGIDWQSAEDTWENVFSKMENRVYIGNPLHLVDEATNIGIFHLGFDVGSFLKTH
jgi:hypothetical protein